MNANRDSIYVVFWMNSQRDPRNAMSHHPYKNQKKERKKERRKCKQGCQLISLFQRLNFFLAAGFRRDFNQLKRFPSAAYIYSKHLPVNCFTDVHGTCPLPSYFIQDGFNGTIMESEFLFLLFFFFFLLQNLAPYD